MFVSLGFLCAMLLGFVIAPAFWARAVRLTTQRIRASLPLTEAEISAERDRLRAENAIRVHQLTARIEQARLYEARQKVEINRRDATVSNLERRLAAIETEREGSENARRVLEATITQRIPEVEGRLSEARQLLAKRDAEMNALQSDTGRTFRALDEAMQVNAQQRAEIDRLKVSVAGQGGRLQGAGAESEASLRSELETLRARSRDQAQLIAKLQADQKGRFAVIGAGAANAANDDETGQHSGEIPFVSDDKSGNDDRTNQVDALRVKVAEQFGEIEKLKAQLVAAEEEAPKNRSLSLRDSKSALKSRFAAAQKEIEQRDVTIATLQRELATANERIAQQASFYTDEMRRLGKSKPAVPSGSEDARANGAASNSPTSSKSPNEGAMAVGAVAVPDVVSMQEPSASEAQRPPSLEERLADTASNSDSSDAAGPANEQLDGTDQSDHKDKLMDRIAALAKR